MSHANHDLFGKTLQATDAWLDELQQQLGPDPKAAWRALGAVLRTVRDRIPVGLAAHLGAQLPLLIRGAYYEHFQPLREPDKSRSLDGFLDHVRAELPGASADEAWQAVRAVFAVIGRHLTPEQVSKVVEALPGPVQEAWPAPGELRLKAG